MPRPTKLRKVEFIPKVQQFIPINVLKDDMKENILKIEEVEAIRLKDAEKLEQEECAEKMEVSRQTFQRILNSGREKIADSIINGKAIRIEGGSFTRNICHIHCLDCNKRWNTSCESFERLTDGVYTCPDCKSGRIVCKDSNGHSFCKRSCRRHVTID
ncbi:putative DNA-binding protein (UPF0251 family) [Ruminiclostridium sufflavum DSM 19573]|uniref:UPF0251 protein LY28_00890 n=1 Tax=Ruminiclostridium sufflavum DSM 19573 TaxID=1121337 RepID=A0A318Y132_9FIRM|nr:DUF134 domain-containing protein [Ruminiclostridium sufflavum]PYG89069.1 putative DNA-binding protein (UPF0251 family) [Ruminiclostridium sufflavum DSM 19573]